MLAPMAPITSLMLALVREYLWQPGTDRRAWLITIMDDQHVNTVRRDIRRGSQVDVEVARPLDDVNIDLHCKSPMKSHDLSVIYRYFL
jgi:DNA-directed RNA polymerase specialized sigma24 family protein